jgi:hypothetical protein
MKQPIFVAIFISVHVVFVFLQIYKHTQLVALSFQKQKNERTLTALQEKKQELTNTWCSRINRSEVKKIVLEQLGMKPIQLSTIKRLNAHDNQ